MLASFPIWASDNYDMFSDVSGDMNQQDLDMLLPQLLEQVQVNGSIRYEPASSKHSPANINLTKNESEEIEVDSYFNFEDRDEGQNIITDRNSLPFSSPKELTRQMQPIMPHLSSNSNASFLEIIIKNCDFKINPQPNGITLYITHGGIPLNLLLAGQYYPFSKPLAKIGNNSEDTILNLNVTVTKPKKKKEMPTGVCKAKKWICYDENWHRMKAEMKAEHKKSGFVIIDETTNFLKKKRG